MSETFFPISQIYALALEVLPASARGYADVIAVLVFALLIGALLRFAVLPLLARWARGNQWPYDDLVVAMLRRRVLVWTMLATLYAEFQDMPWRPRSVALAEKITGALLAASVTFTLIRMVSAAVGRAHSPAAGGTTLIKYIINALLFMLGVGLALGIFGVSVFPALTALGVGGLAVALAFQDTLANVFAGINLSASRQVRVGDYIAVEAFAEGFVDDIGWRATTVRSIDNVLQYIPNKRLAEAVMRNLSRPDPTLVIELLFQTAHEADPERVEAVVVDEVARARAAHPGLAAAAPIVRFQRFGEFALHFAAYVTIERFEDRYALRHALMKRMWARLRAEGLPLPVPQQVVRVTGAPPT